MCNTSIDCLFSKTDLHWLLFKSSLSFTLCSFSTAKLIHSVSILKGIQTFRFYFFVEHFKFIEAYHILLTICKAESTFMIQIVRLQKIIKIRYLFSCIFQQIVVPLQPKSNK